MELSKQKQDEARKLGVSVQHMLLADLMSLGYSEADAYAVAFPENAALSAQQNKAMRAKITSASRFRTLLDERMEKHKGDGVTAIADTELIDKEQTAKMILAAAKKLPGDSKERIEGLMKYSDLMGYKKEDVEGDVTDNISFVFPLKCNQCPLLYSYNNYLRENGLTELKPVEMNRVLSLAHTLIEAARATEERKA